MTAQALQQYTLQTDGQTAFPAIHAYQDFDSAADAVLCWLRQTFDRSLWMITRKHDSYWSVLAVQDDVYGLQTGQVFPWRDSFCAHMLSGAAPSDAPDCQQYPAYAAAPINNLMPIKAYTGVPVYGADGDVFGTLCALDPEVQQGLSAMDMNLIGMLAGLLGLVASQDQALKAHDEAMKKARKEAEFDALTGLMNRRGWDRLVAEEELQVRNYGTPTCMLLIDLDGLKKVNDEQGHQAGDQLIAAAADCIRQVQREGDLAARLGGDEFAIMARDTGLEAGEQLYRALMAAFARAGIRLSVGMAHHQPCHRLTKTLMIADEAMYEMKAANHAGRA